MWERRKRDEESREVKGEMTVMDGWRWGGQREEQKAGGEKPKKRARIINI